MAVDNTTPIDLKLNLQKVNLILVGLGDMPYKVVFELVAELRSQIMAQIKEDPVKSVVQPIRPGAAE